MASRLAWPAVVTVAACGLFAAFLAQSARATYVTSDGASIALQAWDMLHGNLLLRGWAVADVSFYTIDLPEFALVEAIRGFGPFAVHIAAALTYTALVLLAALLAKGRATGREGVTRALIAAGIMLAPELGNPSGVLLLSPDHVATGVPLLLTWIIVDRGASTRWAPVVAGLLLAWTAVGDLLAEVVGALPLAAVCGLRIIQARVARRPLRDSWYELSLLTAAVCAVAVAWAGTHLIAAEGGWTGAPLHTSPAGPGALGHNAALTGHGILQLYGAAFGVQPGVLAGVFAAVHLIGLGLAALGLCLALRRYLSADLVVQVLVAAIAVNLAAYLLSREAQDITNTREIAAVLAFGAALAGRMLGKHLLQPRRAVVAAAVLAGYTGMLVFDAVQPPVPVATADLASWLTAHDLTRGLAGYWQAASVTLYSANRVQVRAIADGPAGLTGETWWEGKKSWYTAGNQANFVISTGSAAQWRDQKLIRQLADMAGRPSAIYQVGDFTVAVWHENLMTKLR
ncbi:MAG TPA: hypothetical protein VFB06_13125 [Streptosporangiaceae bacterium]|nr:hypothetical protein [Streptosporangiaceae bacterium]